MWCEFGEKHKSEDQLPGFGPEQLEGWSYHSWDRENSVGLWGYCESESCSVMSDSLWPPGLYSPWKSPGQNTGMGSLSLLQGIFPTQGSNQGLPHCRQIPYQLSHKGSPGILEWVAYPFSRGSSWPRSRAGVSCLAADSFPAELPGKPFCFIDRFILDFTYEWYHMVFVFLFLTCFTYYDRL